MSEYLTYKELYKENKELKERIKELESELEDLEWDLDEVKDKMGKIYEEASFQDDNYYGNVPEFSSIARMSKRY